jgi:hypothetical protein
VFQSICNVMPTNVSAVDFVSARAPIAGTFSKNCIKKAPAPTARQGFSTLAELPPIVA